MQNRLIFSEGDYEDSFLSGVAGLDTGSNGSGNSSRKLNQGGVEGGVEGGVGIGFYEGRMPSQGSTYYPSEMNNSLVGMGGGRSSVGYYDHFSGVGSGHLDSGIGAMGGDLRVGQTPWGWETYTSYNMIGLFSSHTNNRKIRPFISSISCDPFYELLWLGWTNGFLSSFRFPHCSRYTAFPVGIADSASGSGLFRDNVIYMGFPSSSHLYTVTNSGISIYSRGGAPISSHSYTTLSNDKRQTSKILCCDSNRYQSYMLSSHPIVGIGTGKGVSILDLQQVRPIHSIPYTRSISCIKSSASSSSFIVGGVNMLGIADTRLPRLGHTIQIHPSNSGHNETLVSGLAVNEYTVAVITSTISSRKISSDELLSSVGGVCGLPVLDLIRIHPGEVSTSPEMMVYKKNLDLTNMMRDSVVRLYDTRKFRPRKNVSFSPGPINIAWSDNSLAISAGAASTPDFEDLYIIGNNGQWQIYHSNIDQMEFYATPSVPLSNLNFSSSSNYLILADTSGSIHTMQRPHTNGGLASTSSIQQSTSSSSSINAASTKLSSSGISGGGASGASGGGGGISPSPTFNHQSHQHSFSVFHSYPLPSINIPGTNIGGNYNRQMNNSLYNYSYVKSIQTLMGIASNPVTKPATHNFGHPTIPNLTVALRYLQGRPVVAYDSLNSVGIPPILEKLHNGKLSIREDSLLSFNNKFDVGQIRKIQSEFGWNVYKSSDELPHGLSMIKIRTISRPTDSSLGLNTDAFNFTTSQSSNARSPPNVGNMQNLMHAVGGTHKQICAQSNVRDHNENGENTHGHSGGTLAFSVDYIREVRPEMDHYKLKGLEFRMVDFIKAAINTDTTKYRNNNLVYGIPLLCLRGSMPIWYYRKKKNLALYTAGGAQGPSAEASHAKSLSLVPTRFHYKPKLNPNRREKLKNRRVIGENSGAGVSTQSGSQIVSGVGGVLGHVGTVSSLPNGGDAQTVSRNEDDHLLAGEGLVSIEFDNDILDFTQPFFMLFSFIPKLSYDILLAHVPGCTSEFCLACELVHLTFMLYSCKFNLKKGIGRNPDLFPCVILNSIYTLNILRTVRHIPEIKQLGIDSEDNQQNQVGISGIVGLKFSGVGLGTGAVAGSGSGSGAVPGSMSPTTGFFDDINFNGMTLVSHLPQAAFNQIRKTEIFWKFFLDNLKRDMTKSQFIQNNVKTKDEQETNATDQFQVENQDLLFEKLIDSLFTIEVTTISSCVQAKHAFKSTQIVTYLDIPASHLLTQNSVISGQSLDSTKIGQKNDPALSQKLKTERFLKALNSNLLRIIAGRSFCKECGTSTACQHVRCITKLPQVLVLSCNIQSVKHWNEYGGMAPEEHEEFVKKSHISLGGGSGTNHEQSSNAEYSIPFDIRFSKLRKGFSSQSGSSTGETSGGIDIIQVDKTGALMERNANCDSENSKELKSDNDDSERESFQEYELVALVFGVYQGCSIQLPSGTHFCMYVKHKLLFNEINNTKDKWYMINGSSILPVNNKNEIINFSSCWKLPTFLFYSDKRGSLSNYLFSEYPCLDFQIDLDQIDIDTLVRRISGSEINEQEISDNSNDNIVQDDSNNLELKLSVENISQSDILEIHDIKIKLPWKYPKVIHEHVIQQLESIINLIKNEKNLSENPDPNQINDHSPFTTSELSTLCLNYFVRYPFTRGLLKRPKEINDRLIITQSHSEFIKNSPMVIALDSEYVALEVEQSVVRSDGTKEILKKSQLSLARVSIVRCGKISLTETNESIEINNKKGLIMDHYVSYGSNSQQPRDYLTKYSGVRPGDLDPKTSSHFLTSKSCILKKLQFLVDAGVVFIGHALPSDFKIINIYVPPYQIIDTVEIYRLPEERYISLKFLAKFVLNKNIQTEVHDSIVDAKTALELFLKHLSLKKSGSWNDFLSFLYSKGHSVDWKIEAIENSNLENC